MPGKIRGKTKAARIAPVKVHMHGRQTKNDFVLTLTYGKVQHVLIFTGIVSEETIPDLVVHWRSGKNEEHHSGRENFLASNETRSLFKTLGQDIIDGFKACYLPLNADVTTNVVSAVELKGLY